MELFEDTEDIFSGGSPKAKFYEILYTANKNLVEDELDKLFSRLAVAEKLIEEQGFEEIYEQKVATADCNFDDSIENIKNSLYIETVGAIVTRNE